MRAELALYALAVLSLAVHLGQYAAGRRLQRQTPPRLAPVALPHHVWPTNAGPGRHRRSGAAPDAWIACHSLVCAHLQMPHTQTPAGLVCDECGRAIPGEPMDNYEDFADEVEQPTREEERADEIAFEVAADERRAEEGRLAEREASAACGPDDGECHAEFIDGSWTNCGCEECEDRDAEESL